MNTYRARVGWPLWTHLILALAVLLSLIGALPSGAGAMRLIPAGVAVILAVVWWKMRYLHLEFGSEGASFGFGGPRRRVPRERIRSATPEDYSAARYMGWGYRFGWERRERAYSVLGHRRGIRLRFEDAQGREWAVFLSCKEPEQAVAALGLKA